MPASNGIAPAEVWVIIKPLSQFHHKDVSMMASTSFRHNSGNGLAEEVSVEWSAFVYHMAHHGHRRHHTMPPNDLIDNLGEGASIC